MVEPAPSRIDRITPPFLHENAQFTVYRPREIQPERWYDMIAFAHLAERRSDAPADEPDPIERVREQARQVLGAKFESYRDTTSDSRQAVPRESEITFLPIVPGITFNPERRVFLWLEDVHREEFRLKADRSFDGSTLRGRLSVYLGPIILAEVDMAITVDSQTQTPTASPESRQADHAEPYRKIFVSYSHKDENIVILMEPYARILGDRYVRDRNDLRSGEPWSPSLLFLIEQASVFQLFWSNNSMVSPQVRREWEHALSLGRRSFIRPVYWETPFPESADPPLPPPELSGFHFHRLVVGHPSTDSRMSVLENEIKSISQKGGASPAVTDAHHQAADHAHHAADAHHQATEHFDQAVSAHHQVTDFTNGTSETTPPSRHAASKLQVLKNNSLAKSIDLTKDLIVIGRSPECDIVLASHGLSRRHAEIRRVGDAFDIVDLGSRNFTLVNNVRLERDVPYRLKPGDRISIYDVELRFDAPSRSDLPVAFDAGHLAGELGTRFSAEPDSHPEEYDYGVPATLRENADSKLRTMMAITHAISEDHALGVIMPRVLDLLKELIPEAERFFFLVENRQTKVLSRTAFKYSPNRSRIDAEEPTTLNKAVITYVMNEQKPFISRPAGGDMRPDLGESLGDSNIGSVMCVPIVSSDGRSVGVIQLDTMEQQRFSPGDLECLKAVAAQAAVAMENGELRDSAIALEWISRGLQLAGAVQKRFLPREVPAIPGYEFFAYDKSMHEVGGDFHNFITLPDNRLVVVVGDVAGRGVSASLIMVGCADMIRACIVNTADIKVAANEINKRYLETGIEGTFVTLLLAALDVSKQVHPDLARAAYQWIEVPSSDQFVLCLVNRQDLQLEELVVPEPIGLALHRFNLVVGPLHRA